MVGGRCGAWAAARSWRAAAAPGPRWPARSYAPAA